MRRSGLLRRRGRRFLGGGEGREGGGGWGRGSVSVWGFRRGCEAFEIDGVGVSCCTSTRGLLIDRRVVRPLGICTMPIQTHCGVYTLQ